MGFRWTERVSFRIQKTILNKLKEEVYNFGLYLGEEKI